MVAGFPLFSNFDQCPFDGVFMVNWVVMSGLLPCFVFFSNFYLPVIIIMCDFGVVL